MLDKNILHPPTFRINWKARFKVRTSDSVSLAPVLSQIPSLPTSSFFPCVKGPHEHVCGHPYLHAQAPFTAPYPDGHQPLGPPLSPRCAQNSGIRVHSAHLIPSRSSQSCHKRQPSQVEERQLPLLCLLNQGSSFAYVYHLSQPVVSLSHPVTLEQHTTPYVTPGPPIHSSSWLCPGCCPHGLVTLLQGSPLGPPCLGVSS